MFRDVVRHVLVMSGLGSGLCRVAIGGNGGRLSDRFVRFVHGW
jgi:hypothetical protein